MNKHNSVKSLLDFVILHSCSFIKIIKATLFFPHLFFLHLVPLPPFIFQHDQKKNKYEQA